MKVWEIEKKIADEIKAACQPIEEAIREKYRPMLEEASRQEANHLELVKKSLMKEALTLSLFPVGTRLVQWSRGLRYGSDKWQITGRVGVYEIYEEGVSLPTFPSAPHARPIIRLLRADGTPGKRIELWGINWTNWLPEGQHPETYKHPAIERRGY